MKRAPNQLINGKELSLLDVFVIGTNAHEQLNRFFKITNILADPQELLKLTNKMELAEFNNANQTTVNNNGAYSINQHQQIIGNQQSQAQQIPSSKINIGPPHIYRNHQQHQQQQPGLRYSNNPKLSKHRELPVDVPDSFVGIAKQSPRYPPPKPHRQISPSMPMNNLTTFNHAPSTVPYNGANNVSNCAQQPNIPPLSQNNVANIVAHNSSLRSSIKLKQLEKSRNGQHGNYPVGQMQPAINQAFELNEGDSLPMPTNQNNNHPITTTVKQDSKSKQQMPDLCSIYNRLQRNIHLNGDFADVSGDAKLTKLLSIYNTIVQTHNKQFKIPTLLSRHTIISSAQGVPEPLAYKVLDLLESVRIMLNGEAEMTNDAAELFVILCKHEVEGVCSAFDRIAQSFEFAKSSRPTSPQSMEIVSENGPPQPPMFTTNNQGMLQIQSHRTDDYDYAPEQVQMDIENNLYQNSLHPLTDIDLSDGTCTKTVIIEKTSNQALGATIKNDVDGNVVIGRIVHGGAAHGSGLLHEGDEILEVNGVEMRGKNVNEVVNILERMNGTLTFTVVARSYNKNLQRNLQEKVFVRAFFKYDGENDEFIPCKELGLSFEKRDILTIIDQSDPKWWQAHREGDSECRLAGLIPSIDFLKQREKVSNPDDTTTDYFKLEKKTFVSKLFNCPKGSSPRRRKKPPNIPFGPDEIPYYEEVCLYYPIKYRKRPIILVGPKMIGQREIVAKLLQDSNRFASAISHTSKPMQEHERNGVDFHFVTRAQFEADIKAGKFIECGQYQNQYYGTSLDAMKEVVRSKKVSFNSLLFFKNFIESI